MTRIESGRGHGCLPAGSGQPGRTVRYEAGDHLQAPAVSRFWEAVVLSLTLAALSEAQTIAPMRDPWEVEERCKRTIFSAPKAIDYVTRHRDSFRRHLKLKQLVLGAGQLNCSDAYARAVTRARLKYTCNETLRFLPDAFKPLGEDCVSAVKKAFDAGWIDVYPTFGKRAGAYSCEGGHYGLAKRVTS